MDIQWIYGIDLKMKKVEKWKTNVNVHLEMKMTMKIAVDSIIMTALEMKLIKGLEMESTPKNETGNEKSN